jgi:hypothetical protein
MRRNTLIALAGVTAIVTLAAILVPSGHPDLAKTQATGPVFPDLKDWIASAAKLTVTGPDGAVVLERHVAADDKTAKPADGWVFTAKGGYPVQLSTMQNVLSGLASLKTVQAMTERPKLYSRLDLGDPGKDSQARALELTKSDGAAILKLIVGKKKYDTLGQGHDGVYIRKPDDARTWLAEPAITLPTDQLGWIDRKVLDIDADTIKDIVLTPDGGKPLELSRDKKEDKFQVKDLPKDAKLKQQDPGEAISSSFRYLDLDDVKPAAQVTAPAAATAHIETFGGLSCDVTLIKQDGTWVTIAVKGTGDSAKQADEIAKRTGGWAYKIADARAATLQDKLSDLVEAPKPAAPEAPKGKTAAPK